jgi:hypothetical protein
MPKSYHPYPRELEATASSAECGDASAKGAYEPFSETVREDPYPYYAALRDEAPVYWAEGAQAWCVSRYDDVQFVLRNAELFSSDAMLPVADAGPDQNVSVGASVQLDGSGSTDPNGGPLTYAWSLTTRPAGSRSRQLGTARDARGAIRSIRCC